jgi:hypothetical protein
MPPAPVAQPGGYRQGQPATGRGGAPEPIDRGMDGWFLDRVLGRR